MFGLRKQKTPEQVLSEAAKKQAQVQKKRESKLANMNDEELSNIAQTSPEYAYALQKKRDEIQIRRRLQA